MFLRSGALHIIQKYGLLPLTARTLANICPSYISATIWIQIRASYRVHPLYVCMFCTVFRRSRSHADIGVGMLLYVGVLPAYTPRGG